MREFTPVPKPVPKEKKQQGKIKPRSTKRAQQERTYAKIRPIFLANNPVCKARLQGCMGASSQIHHSRGRIGKLLTDIRHFIAVCASCHDWIEIHPIQAKQLGLSKSRLHEGG